MRILILIAAAALLLPISAQAETTSESTKPAVVLEVPDGFTPVKSSVIHAVKWEEKGMTIIFTSGKKYLYRDLPLALYEHFMDARSKGTVFQAKIRNRYTSKLLD